MNNKKLKNKVVLRLICTIFIEEVKNLLLIQLSQLLTKGGIIGVSYKPYWKYENAVECMYLIRFSKKIDISQIALILDKRFIHLDDGEEPIFSKQIASGNTPFLDEQVEWATIYYAWRGIEKYFDRCVKKMVIKKTPCLKFKRYPAQCRKRVIQARC